jgi:hypothetical protein
MDTLMKGIIISCGNHQHLAIQKGWMILTNDDLILLMTE